MPIQTFEGATFDDVLRAAYEGVLARGERVVATQGAMAELQGAVIEISDPRSRISLTESRGKLVSCLGELLWYLSGSEDLAFIEYYLPRAYRKYAIDGKVSGAYGPRLFGDGNQIHHLINMLKAKRSSRQAVIQVFSATDLGHPNPPCTCTLQFLLRENGLNLVVNMRSNDLVKGFAHDVFSFTMLQEIVARSLDVELGWYKHIVGSLHIYDNAVGMVETFLNEGWQSTKFPMDPMPPGDPFMAIDTVLTCARMLREGEDLPREVADSLDVYWRDLVTILELYAARKAKDWTAVVEKKKQIHCNSLRQVMNNQVRDGR